MDPRVGDVPGGDVHVRDGKIIAVGPKLSAAKAEVVDARDTIVMPGFIECHWHMWNSIWRGMAHDAQGYFALHRLAEFYTAEDHYTAVRYAATEGLSAGITTCHDWAHGLRTGADANAEMQALVDSGVRARFGYGDTPPGAGRKIDIQELRRARSWLESHAAGRVTLGLVVQNSDAVVEEFAIARELGLKTIAPHANTSAHPELMGPDVIYTHGAGASADTFRALAARKVKIGLCPHTDPLVGGGWPPLQEMLSAGIAFEDIGFTVDVSCQTAADPFSAMRILMYAARIAQSRAQGVDGFTAIPRERRLDLMLPRKLVQLATINGARVLGLDDVTGSLTPGKRADLILVRTDDANMLPAQQTNPTFQLVQHGQPANVDTVLVDGRVLKRGGAMVGLDPRALARKAAQAQMAIRQRASLPPINSAI